jgi:hypothetical protein
MGIADRPTINKVTHKTIAVIWFGFIARFLNAC